MKKLVAYSSVSHLGFVVLGLCALTVTGVQGAVFQMLAHGISTGGLFLVVGMLSERRHTRLIAEYGGIKAVAPRLVAAFLLVTLASVALPGMNGFVGEFLILIGTWGGLFEYARIYTTIAASGVILSAVYMLWMFQRVNYGPVTDEKTAALADLQRPLELGARDPAPYPLLRLLAGLVRKPDDGEGGDAALEVRLDLDGPGVETVERMGERACEHTMTLGTKSARVGHGFVSRLCRCGAGITISKLRGYEHRHAGGRSWHRRTRPRNSRRSSPGGRSSSSP